jgi:hypothetical protein
MKWLRVPLPIATVLICAAAHVLPSIARTQAHRTASAEGEQPLYIVREIVQTSSDGGIDVEWLDGPAVVCRHRVLEGEDSEHLWYDPVGLSVRMGKQDEINVALEAECLALAEGDMARASVSKGASGAASVEFSAYDVASETFLDLGQVALGVGETGPVWLEFGLDALYDLPVATADVGQAIREMDKKVFAFYYNWYANAEGPAGWWFHWEDVEEYSIGSSTHYPLMGAYDSLDERVILAHLEIARYAGIDALIANWAGPDSFEDETMPVLLELAEEYGIGISAYSAATPYASHPAWLTDDGRPVFFLWAPQNGTPSEWLAFRASLEGDLGPVVLIGNTLDPDYLGVFDGFHMYICMPEEDGTVCLEGYHSPMGRLKMGPRAIPLDDAFSAAYAGQLVPLDIKLLFVSVIPGYDDTKVRDPGIVRDRMEGQLYDDAWNAALQLDAQSVLLTSFNEWHEGTEIEPSSEYGFDYLTKTKQYVEQYKGVTLPAPLADFSLIPGPFTVSPDGRGRGTLVLAAAGEVPALYLELEAVAVEGISDLALEGDFYTYRVEDDGSRVSELVPGVFPGSPLEVTVAFTATQPSPRIEIHAAAYDPGGTRYDIYGGRPPIIELASAYLPLVLAPPGGSDAGW